MGFNFVRDILENRNRKKISVVMSGEDFSMTEETYGKMLDNSYRLVNFLKKKGLRAGDRILVLMRNSHSLYHVITASIAMGLVFAPAALILPEDQIRYRVEQIDAKAIFVDNSSEQKVKNIHTPTINMDSVSIQRHIGFQLPSFTDHYDNAEAEHAIFFTSGTEGRSKMIVHNGNYPLGHRTTVSWLGLEKDDLHWNISSPGWAKWAWSSYYSPFLAGSTVFNLNYNRFNAALALEALHRFKVTSLCAPPTVWRMFLLEDFSEKALYLKKASSAGEPLNPEIIERFWRATGIRIKDGYGQTESTLMVGNTDGNSIKPGSMGKPLHPYRVDIVDEKGNILKPGETGFIAVKVDDNRPVGLFMGYMNDPELTAERFSNGYYYTGDTAYKDEDGYIWFDSRFDDVIKSSDYRIGPFEVESALLEHPSVAESAVVGSPDKLRGDLVKAFVVLKPGYRGSRKLASELSSLVRRSVGPHARPRIIEFVDALPKTISGKIIRKRLREIEIKRFLGQEGDVDTDSQKEFRV